MQLRTSMSWIVLAAVSAGWVSAAVGQAGGTPAAPTPQATPAPSAPAAAAPSAPAAPVAAPEPPFPPVDPANFTAPTPTKETVQEFLHAFWGYDDSRIWQVQAILTTPASGVSRVIVLVRAKNAGPKDQTQQLAFYTLPDGKFLVADALLPFGAKPFADYRELLQSGATGPSKGAASKALEFVEFSDYECPHCKDAQPVVAKLLGDFPSAHFVYQFFPLTEIHPEAMQSALEGYCVAKLGGSEAFFKFSDALFDTQAGLTPQTAQQTLKDAATKAGQDPAKIAACAETAGAKDAIKDSVALGGRVGVSATPTLFVNGRALPLVGIPYDALVKIIVFQAKLDGLNIPTPAAAPSLKPEPIH